MNVQANFNPVDHAYGMTTYVYVDIETIPAQSPEAIAAVRASVKPPANIKKPESIEKWRAESAADAADDAVAKTSFDGGRGHVCTIAWGVNGGDIQVRHARNIADERLVISDFFADLPRFHSVTLVGHNIAGFDIPFLRKRAIALGIQLPPANVFPRDPKAWDKSLHDTMTMWAGSRDTISMDTLCEVLGIAGKDGMDGSKVAAAWAGGMHHEIAMYCMGDVDRTRAIHQRFLAAGW